MANKNSTSSRIKKSAKTPNNGIAAHGSGDPALDYRHDAPRKNIPTAGLAAQGKVQQVPKLQYAYNPHLPPQLRFDATGKPDALPELLRIARSRALSDDEAQELAEALRNREPWLEWAGKRELPGFAVEPVALHIHERISAQAIVKVAARLDVERDLFADPELSYKEAVQFYQHDVEWSNRMILGDSLQVMASLAQREGLAGKVQMIYVDPPYGISFRSNFQSEIARKEVKERDSDLTREPEMVKAYRDTWELFSPTKLTAAGLTPSCVYEFVLGGVAFRPKQGSSWRTNQEGMKRSIAAERLIALGDSVYQAMYYDDYPATELTNLWTDTRGEMNTVYVVQTASRIVERCMLMTTDPGDLVLDPTCGSGTAAYVAEQWGRRWITIDSSRVPEQ